jgi:hypothetical protein
MDMSSTATAGVGDDRPYPQRQGLLPRDLAAVTPEFLTSVMRNRYPGLEIRDMETVEIRNGHTTKMRVRLDLNQAGRDAGIPENVCLKSNWSGGFEEVDIHALEARFYHYARDQLNIPSPKAYFADWDAGATGQGLVVMEDLALEGGRFGHSTDHMGVDGVAEAFEGYAKYHGASWGDPRLREWIWLQTSMDTPIDNEQLRFMWQWVEKNLAKEKFRAILPKWFLDDPQSLHRIFDALALFEARNPGPNTIVHGDSHQGNTYVRADGERIWIDWQLVRKGRPWRDLAYFMIGALTIEERRADDRRLLKHYHEHLLATGIADPPSFDTIWAAYSRWPIYGCQAWIANMDEWGQDGLPMNQRFFTALEDLDSAKLLLQEY